MELPTDLKISICELAIDKLSNKHVGDLILPIGSKGYAFSGIASAVQLAFTWGRRSKTRNLILKKSIKGLDKRIENVMDLPHKFASIMFCKKSSAAQDNNILDIKEKLNRMASNRIDKQATKKFGFHRGRLCWFCFVDHSSKGFDKNFYIETDKGIYKPRQREQIESIIKSMAQKSVEVAGATKKIPEPDSTALGRLFYELFLNTHEHGSREKENRSLWIRPGVRIIYSYGINLRDVAVKKLIETDLVIKEYIENLGMRGNFIEIGIIDSGIGLVDRWIADREDRTDKNLSFQEELDIIKKCFSFRESSFDGDEKGNGLPVVLERLTKLKGFLRIRTGRLSLYRNFAKNPYQGNGDTEFYDWNSEKKIIREYSPVEGTAITLLVPLERKEEC